MWSRGEKETRWKEGATRKEKSQEEKYGLTLTLSNLKNGLGFNNEALPTALSVVEGQPGPLKWEDER
ncbi:hypothetical protein Pcinc_037028 [Petrolisthes cinctipes]|uniref:Uncharacterized protein n=1 Tax=Petrolisthes cinctipes TaxID=88211 RepID=A0AAE1ELS1_PETCI|nr:hypothetical protein Pcinc_037028 [Petrolisthes cinctipes]